MLIWRLSISMTKLKKNTVQKVLNHHALDLYDSWIFLCGHIEKLRYNIAESRSSELLGLYFYQRGRPDKAISGLVSRPWLKNFANGSNGYKFD